MGTGEMRDIFLPLWLVYLLSVFPVWMLLAGSFESSQMIWALATGLLTLPLINRILELRRRVGILRILRRMSGVIIAFFLLFVPDAVRSAMDMAWRLIRPTVPMRPGIVAVSLPLQDRFELLLFLNHVTLTPGQFVVDYDLEEGRLYVHAIDASHPEKIRAELQALHRKGRRLTA